MQLLPPVRSSCAFVRATLRHGCDDWFDLRCSLGSSVAYKIFVANKQRRRGREFSMRTSANSPRPRNVIYTTRSSGPVQSADDSGRSAMRGGRTRLPEGIETRDSMNRPRCGHQPSMQGVRKGMLMGAAVLAVACGTTEGGAPFEFDSGAPYVGDAGFGSGVGEDSSPPQWACPYPPPRNGESCASIDKGRDFELTCVYDPCGGEADPTPGSPDAFVAICFKKTWTLIPGDAGDICMEPSAFDAGTDAADAADAADASDD